MGTSITARKKLVCATSRAHVSCRASAACLGLNDVQIDLADLESPVQNVCV